MSGSNNLASMPRAGLRVAGVAALALLPLLAACATHRPSGSSTAAEVAHGSDDETAFMCPMHPDVVESLAGRCPRCGMALVLGAPFDMRNYVVEVRTSPEAIVPGRPTTVVLAVRRPGTGEPVTAFEVVHDKPFHLFVVGQDLEFFEHLHPEQNEAGAWTIDVTFPKAGHYKLLADFVPAGGSAQFIAHSLVTAGYTGDIIGDGARLVPDGESSRTVTVGDLRASLTVDPSPLNAAMHGHLTVHLARADTGDDVRDLQPYLGAFGHMLIVSEDLVDFVHSHPVESLLQGVDPETQRSGPTVVFEGVMPRPGRYRAWGQFRHAGTVHTFPFTFETVEAGAFR